MKANIRALLDRVIRDGIDHTFLNTEVQISSASVVQLAHELEGRIWLYIDEYFDFEDQ